jgi:hypothetical protein
MRRAWADLSRVEEVRDSARGWKSAGAIDETTLGAIEAAYPDPRVRLHGFWRVLVFVLVSVIVNALYFFVQSGSSLFVLSLVFGALLAGATEALRGSRYSGTGADAATSFWTVTYLLVAAGDALFRGHGMREQAAITAMIAVGVLVGAIAACRWGFWLYAACAAAAAFALIARAPYGRLSWILLGAAAMALLRPRLDTPALPPDLRRCAAAVFAVAGAAIYAAVNLFSVDQRLVEMIQGHGAGFEPSAAPPSSSWRLLSKVATALLPVIYLAWGVRARRRILLALGLLTAALSAATLRYYVHLAPIWEVLAVCGAILIGAAIAIQRALRRRPRGEWRGLTAEPLYERERDGISPLAALAAHAAGGAHPATARERGGLTTGGGEYGGGGATGSY